MRFAGNTGKREGSAALSPKLGDFFAEELLKAREHPVGRLDAEVSSQRQDGFVAVPELNDELNRAAPWALAKHIT